MEFGFSMFSLKHLLDIQVRTMKNDEHGSEVKREVGADNEDLAVSVLMAFIAMKLGKTLSHEELRKNGRTSKGDQDR